MTSCMTYVWNSKDKCYRYVLPVSCLIYACTSMDICHLWAPCALWSSNSSMAVWNSCQAHNSIWILFINYGKRLRKINWQPVCWYVRVWVISWKRGKIWLGLWVWSCPIWHICFKYRTVSCHHTSYVDSCSCIPIWATLNTYKNSYPTNN